MANEKTAKDVWSMAAAHPGDVVMLILGAWVGWLLNPLVWIVGGPLRWPALLLVRAAQESGYNAANKTGDNGASHGILQFNIANIDLYGDGTTGWRTSAYQSGRAAADYVSDALTTSGTWWRWLASPSFTTQVEGIGWLWTHGLSGYHSVDQAPAAADAETYTRPAAALWWWVLVFPGLLMWLAVVALAYRRWYKGRK